MRQSRSSVCGVGRGQWSPGMNHNWLQLYQAGVPATLDDLPWPSLADMIADSCQRHAERDACTSMDTTLTYADIERQSRAFAAWLQQTDTVHKGDRIALMMPNCLQYVVTLLGALRAGLVVINVNPLYTARELEHQLSDSGATTIVVLENFAAKLEKVFDNVAVTTVITTRLGDFQKATKRLLTNFTIKAVKKGVPEWALPNAHDLRQVLEAGSKHSFDPPVLKPTDLAFLQYTGGTTGPARGARLSHGNLVANVAQCHAWVAPEL